MPRGQGIGFILVDKNTSCCCQRLGNSINLAGFCDALKIKTSLKSYRLNSLHADETMADTEYILAAGGLKLSYDMSF